MLRKYSKEFLAAQVQPAEGKPLTKVLRFRCNESLWEAVTQNTDDPSGWLREVVVEAAKKEGWLD
jgi:hypothetical protein